MPQSRILTRRAVEFCTTGEPSRRIPLFPIGASLSPILDVIQWLEWQPRRVYSRMQMSKRLSRPARNKKTSERIGEGAIDARESILDRGGKESRVSVMRHHERRLSLSHERRRILWCQGFDGGFCSNAHLFSILHTDKFLYPRPLYSLFRDLLLTVFRYSIVHFFSIGELASLRRFIYFLHLFSFFISSRDLFRSYSHRLIVLFQSVNY